METPTTAVARIINGAVLAELEEQTREVIISRFSNFLERASEWEEKALALKVTDISQVEEMKQAREARLILKNIRVEADKTRQELKADSLRYAKAVQGVYNLIDDTITPIEDYLMNQEKFAEYAERDRLNALRTARQKEMMPYQEYVPLSLDLGPLPEEEYQKFFKMAQAQYEAAIQAANEAALAKIAAEQYAEEERKRLAKENEALLLKQRQLAAEQRETKRIAAEKLAESEKQRKEAEAKLLEQQRQEQARLDAIKAQEEARKKAERKEKRAPDKAKLLALADTIDATVVPSMKTEELQKIADGARTLLNKTAVYIRQSIETIEKA